MSFEKQTGPQNPEDPQDIVPSHRVRPAGDLEAMRQAGMPVIGPEGSLPTLRPAPVESLMVSILGDVRRSGQFALATTTKTVSLIGNVLLDLREAELAAPEVEIQVYSLLGDLKIIVPPDMDVVLRGVTALGNQRYDPGPHSSTVRRRRLTVHAYGLMGDVKVKTLAVGEVEPKWWRRFME